MTLRPRQNDFGSGKQEPGACPGHGRGFDVLPSQPDHSISILSSSLSHRPSPLKNRAEKRNSVCRSRDRVVLRKTFSVSILKCLAFEKTQCPRSISNDRFISNDFFKYVIADRLKISKLEAVRQLKEVQVFHVAAFGADGKVLTPQRCDRLGGNQGGPRPCLSCLPNQIRRQCVRSAPIRGSLHRKPEGKRSPAEASLLYWADSYDAIICYPEVTPSSPERPVKLFPDVHKHPLIREVDSRVIDEIRARRLWTRWWLCGRNNGS